MKYSANSVWENKDEYDVAVVGAGHAGCEAALATARLGFKTVMFTVSVDSIALMPCNPNIGGSSKGHLVRELDALGGEMGKVIDRTFIQSKMLNSSKGPAVHSLRAQADKANYSRTMRQVLENTDHLQIVQAEVCEILVENEHVTGVKLYSGAIYHAKAVILCTGTYLKARCIYGDVSTYTGPNGLQAANHLTDSLKNLGIEKVDGIVLDLGVSSFQLDTPKRGFTYMEENAPLDMRMDQRESRTARDIVNTYSEKELYRIIRDFGEDKFAKNIAKHIVAAREKQPIETTGELTAIIRSAIPKKVQMSGGHPAKRTFQAIRIELNRELEVLQDTLDDMIELLNEDGRICIITFHSLEDRIVKTIFKKNENPCTCPSDFPVCVCGKESKGKVITRKPILPGEEELRENSRSKSAKLRVFERR